MKGTITEKIIREHLVEGELAPGKEIGLRIDQTLTQDATGTMTYLQFEAIGIERVKTELSVSYIDHNTLQVGFENADDHLYLAGVARKHGIYLSRAGNGICHQVHLERFARPGKTLLGADSHTPTAGGVSSLAIGVGGLDVAAAMAGSPFYLTVPKIRRIVLLGELPPWVSAKDVILELLRQLTVSGGVGWVMEYDGPGVATLSVPQRATIANMGAELGATTSIFPSDERTREWLQAQRREEHWTPLAADSDAEYEEEITLDLSSLEPLVAQPHMPDRVVPVREVAGVEIDQVAIGSCTNSSYVDLMTAAAMVRGKVVPPTVSFVVAPGSRQVLSMIAGNGALQNLIDAGARILEAACGPCLGVGQAPRSGGTTVRSFNRNFKGRSGTVDAAVYLASVETCVASALTGKLTDPRDLGEAPVISLPEAFHVDDAMIVAPAPPAATVHVIRGPNIKPVPVAEPPSDELELNVLIKLGDNITTDDILPAGAQLLSLRSNIPAYAEHVLTRIDPDFPRRAKAAGGGCILGGANYGQGSSREHAALAPLFLGVRAVLAKSFARIHRSNLINFGILPLIVNETALATIEEGTTLRLQGIHTALNAPGGGEVAITVAGGPILTARLNLAPREAKILRAGGLLNYLRQSAE
ncbi:MAG: aconitate hydratase [Candidatus Zipacnadales bacterium]